MGATHRLIVRQLIGEGEPRFVVLRAADDCEADPVSIAPPGAFAVSGTPAREFMGEVAWYLERFLEYPFPPQTERADRVVLALRTWGRMAFSALFGRGRARDFYRDAIEGGLGGLVIEIRADEPSVLSWPWEALEDADRIILALGCQVERRLTTLPAPEPLPESLPGSQLNILLAIARPYETDVPYRSIARPLVETLRKQGLSATLTVLRPPTFARLQEVLGERAGHFHVLHFDGHGGYGLKASSEPGPRLLRGPLGHLLFETDEGQPDPVDSEKLATLLRGHRLPAVVLNACQSAMVDDQAEDVFASVAAALLKGGVRSVVAMAYSLYVSGAKYFLPAFYRRLLETGDMAEAARAGRGEMYEKPTRLCAGGTYDLEDWLVPVVYQQDKLDLAFAKGVFNSADQSSALPDEADDTNPYGFIGRDSALLQMERAMHRSPSVILINGLGGVGKTTLAKGFLRWLSDTGGLGHGALWVNFSDVRSAESVFNQLVVPLFGLNALAASFEDKVTKTLRTLRERPFVIVWDNFESARGAGQETGVPGLLPANDQLVLKRLLEALRNCKTKVIITSRSDEDWLGPENCSKVSLRGLQGEERWELCRQILSDIGRTADQANPEMAVLVETLGGHPLLMRAALPLLQGATPGAILAAVNGNLAALGTGGGMLDRVVATLRFVETSLPPRVQPLLAPLALHEGLVVTDDLKVMAERVSEELVPLIDEFIETLAVAGLVSGRGNNIYEVHAALTGFLRHGSDAQLSIQQWKQAFVDRMAALADYFAPRPAYEQSAVFAVHEGNFCYARSLAQESGMDANFGALTQSLALRAHNTRSLAEAATLYEELARHSEQIEHDNALAGALHQLGIVAQERRDFDTAEHWYGRSLAISEKLDDEHAMARTYFKLGTMAHNRRDIAAAETWYLKCLTITERLEGEHGSTFVYHQLGLAAYERRDFEAAEKWHLKSLAIEEKEGGDAAPTYHALGNVARECGNSEAAVKWYLKALAIVEQRADEQGMAVTYHQLGMVAEDLQDLESAESWFLKALLMKDKRGDEHGAALTCHQLGVVAYDRGDFEASCDWIIRSTQSFLRQHDEVRAATNRQNLSKLIEPLPEALRVALRERWRRSGLPDLPP